MALLLAVPRSNAAAFNPAASDYTSLALIRGKENQLLLRLPVDDKKPIMVLDTGSPVTCVDESKSKMFNLVSSSENGSSPMSVTVNGMRHRIAIAPSLIFGPLQVQNLPVVLIDLGSLNQMLKARHDHPNDAILGLDTLHALHAVIDCGTGQLLLPNGPQSADNLETKLKQDGWMEIPMRVDQGHLVVHGSVNRSSLDFVVDTGSPVSVLDQAFSRSHHITLTDQSFALRAIHFETGGAKVGKVADMKIGKLDINRTLVAVFDVTALLRGQAGSGNNPLGLLGSRTLLRAQAYIDCENSRLYMKIPPPTPTWGF
jgi:predicted aspartyl protease